jgi:hypothetical protein
MKLKRRKIRKKKRKECGIQDIYLIQEQGQGKEISIK